MTSCGEATPIQESVPPSCGTVLFVFPSSCFGVNTTLQCAEVHCLDPSLRSPLCSIQFPAQRRLVPIILVLTSHALCCSARGTRGHLSRRFRRHLVARLARCKTAKRQVHPGRRSRRHTGVDHGDCGACVQQSVGPVAGRADCRTGCAAGRVAQGRKCQDGGAALLQCQEHAQLEGQE